MRELEKEEGNLPPRRRVHPSYSSKWTHRFYVTLVFLFCLLIVALILWYLWHPAF